MQPPLLVSKTWCRAAPGLVELGMGRMGCKSLQMVGNTQNWQCLRSQTSSKEIVQTPNVPLGHWIIFQSWFSLWHTSSLPPQVEHPFILSPGEFQVPPPQIPEEQELPQNFKLGIFLSAGQSSGGAPCDSCLLRWHLVCLNTPRPPS